MTQLLLSIALAFRPPLLHIFSSALFLEAQGLTLSVSASCSLVFFMRVLSGFSLLYSTHFSSSFHTYFYQLYIFLHQNYALLQFCSLFYYFLPVCSRFISSSLQSISTFPSLCLSASHFISFHSIPSLSISPPPAVAEDDKPPYTILCAQAALDKSCSVEGVGVGAGWGPQRNGFNLNYSS